jgi:hypothetical protein
MLASTCKNTLCQNPENRSVRYVYSLFPCRLLFCVLSMEAAPCPETLVAFYQTTRCRGSCHRLGVPSFSLSQSDLDFRTLTGFSPIILVPPPPQFFQHHSTNAPDSFVHPLCYIILAVRGICKSTNTYTASRSRNCNICILREYRPGHNHFFFLPASETLCTSGCVLAQFAD